MFNLKIRMGKIEFKWVQTNESGEVPAWPLAGHSVTAVPSIHKDYFTFLVFGGAIATNVGYIQEGTKEVGSFGKFYK